jgi:hypothetical protein
MNLLQRSATVIAVFAASAMALAVAGSRSLDDATILAKLQPTNNNDVEILILRDGTPHDVAYVSRPEVRRTAIAAPTAVPVATRSAKVSNARSVVAIHALTMPLIRAAPLPSAKIAPVSGTSSPMAMSKPASLPNPVIDAKPVASLRPVTLPKAVVVARMRYAGKPIRLAKPEGAESPITNFVVAKEGSFVATADIGKPLDIPTAAPASQHDLNWEYAHRFDPASDDDDSPIPGIPVRSQVSSPFDTRSGAFHGVRARNGFSAARITVSIPCGVSKFQQGQGFNEVTQQKGLVDQETGYIYIGGWGAGSRGAGVDAGLQKSSAQSASDDYAFYWKYANNRPVTSTRRFPCGGPDVTLSIYPVSDDLLVFSANGVTADGQRRTLIAVQRTRAEDGWDPTGGSPRDGVILKRLVSIAQPAAWRTDLDMGLRRWRSGTYFGVVGPNDPSPKIVWRKCEIGNVHPPRIVPDYHEWTDSDSWHPRSPGVYTDWPPKGIFLSSQGVCDVVGLYLRNS